VGEEEGGGEDGRGRGWELGVGASGICGGGRKEEWGKEGFGVICESWLLKMSLVVVVEESRTNF